MRTQMMAAAVLSAVLLSGCLPDAGNTPAGTAETLPALPAGSEAETAGRIEDTDTDTAAPETAETDPPTETAAAPAVSAVALPFREIVLPCGGSVMPRVTVIPADAAHPEIVWHSTDPAVAAVDADGRITAAAPGTCTVSASAAGIAAEIAVTVGDADACTYIDGILIVNKSYPLPQSYAPGMDADAFAQLCRMFDAAKSEGITLRVKSSYRSYADQRVIYSGYAARDGQAAADRYSARPGHSEHQSGLAFDLNELTESFGESAEGVWLRENCHRYGFILRYPRGKEEVTGYMYEPWHVRYVGEDAAAAIHESGLTLEEFFGITSVYQ